jgi:hypothetical protein
MRDNHDLLDLPLTALFCSRKCPGNVILRAYDLAVGLRDAGVPVIGGFHTPMERELLAVLLRGTQPVVIVEAREQRRRIPGEWRTAIDAGRLLVLAPFPGVKRQTRQTSAERNRLVLSYATRVLILHASAGGETERIAQQTVNVGKPLLTLVCGDDANANLIALGAVEVDAGSIKDGGQGLRRPWVGVASGGKDGVK